MFTESTPISMTIRSQQTILGRMYVCFLVCSTHMSNKTHVGEQPPSLK